MSWEATKYFTEDDEYFDDYEELSSELEEEMDDCVAEFESEDAGFLEPDLAAERFVPKI